MTPQPSALWQVPLPPDIEERLEQILCSDQGPVEIFFRADDVGRIDRHSTRLIEVFSRHGMPLCPALVPRWLTEDSWQALQALVRDPQKFCWHQHGLAHVNHESQGKKNEFGEGRSRAEVEEDIASGRNRLRKILGSEFFPVFTPPWNRCSGATMEILARQGFAALSRSINVQPQPPAGLPDIPINIDLHTRREDDPVQGMDNLLEECRRARQGGRMGFMIHHQRMNDTAFSFLVHLFSAIAASPGLRCCTFRDLVQAQTEKSGS